MREYRDSKVASSNPNDEEKRRGTRGTYNRNRRRFLAIAAAAAGAIGAALAGIPFMRSLLPSEKARAVGGPVTVDISSLEPNHLLTVIWRGKPIWILKRTSLSIEQLQSRDDDLRDPNSLEDQQPDYAKNPTRSIRPDVLVAIGICTHLGCVPLYRPETKYRESDSKGWSGGFFCPCHGSTFDLAGRVYRGVPAPLNLRVPPHHYLAENTILIGTSKPPA